MLYMKNRAVPTNLDEQMAAAKVLIETVTAGMGPEYAAQNERSQTASIFTTALARLLASYVTDGSASYIFGDLCEGIGTLLGATVSASPSLIPEAARLPVAFTTVSGVMFVPMEDESTVERVPVH